MSLNPLRRLATKVGLTGLVALSAAACSSEAGEESSSGSVSSPLLGGSDGTAQHPEVGQIVFQSATGTGGRCTIELLTPTLAVTVLQCLADQYFPGNSQGSGQVCAPIGVPYDKSLFVVTVGGQTRNVAQIINDGQVDTCTNDLAFIVLDQPVQNVAFPKLELDALPAVGDAVTACGFGSTSNACSFPTTVQCSNGSVLIANGGYYAPDFDQFAVGNAVSTNSGCGDDGGPLYSASTGAVVAIMGLNFNGNKSDIDTFQDPCQSCTDSVVQSTLLSAHADFVARAFASVGLAPPREGHPAPADLGGTCVEALDCNSQLCVGVGSTGYCSEYCDSSACPDDSTCTPVDGQKVCLPTVKPDPASCAVAGRSPTRDDDLSSALLWGAGAVALFGRRKRQQARRRAR